MVKIAIAGGSSGVGREFTDALVATNKHEILLLSHKDAPPTLPARTTWIKTTYSSTAHLAEVLSGVHTVLSFIIEQESETSPVQRRLIDACVVAGVTRFAPSEWASSSLRHLPWYAYKASIRRYLAELNKEKQVLQYALFQPGLFADYLAAPHRTSRYIVPLQIPVDFANRRAILVDGVDAENARITLTTVADFAAVMVKAVEWTGEWPVDSGIAGTTMTLSELVRLGEKVRGGIPFNIEKVSKEDFLSGTWKTSWVPRNEHPSVPVEMQEGFARPATEGICLAFAEGAFGVRPVWNGLLPGFGFEGAEGFLGRVWGKE
ncbi:uncharacterized protein DSM5745_04117 [Aspergillus mulundensis]|uniref:NmrA-like domain-containing protein n=1 Tax=Aspergillus mulundensis TaxID=1810919 RepID=A0A3D8SC96_9EURO|nr:Uncharacterized protein DSM5745_04117 [Aspergillus mulundensis]RDW83791.1 Uncharacterized protein DSM5745_04117 [Aspergillus mulundensis]